MRLATWNVNSLKARLARVEAWLTSARPDVLCLQETKSTDAAFPADRFTALGYESVHHGNGRWNGVAVLSRVGLDAPRAAFHDEDRATVEECRIVSATCAGARVVSVYVPNGRVVDSEFYVAKLAWLGRLRAELDTTCEAGSPVAVCGDFNVAPEDRDVWDVAKLDGMTHVTAAERDALASVSAWGLRDVVRELAPVGREPGPFSWWDYRGGAFHKGEGMRIDLALLSEPLAARVTAAYVDREERKKGPGGEVPSDHAPVVVDLDW
ncbi:MAG TPA: exodeoxyribonuclease III [Acidimicrobiales bacterium]|nr:exodeoxyribonuclease III [Acidimicrobiales bacterium]